jgi:hypothetical protein
MTWLQRACAVRPPLHWSVPNLVPTDTDDVYEHAYSGLFGRIDRLATALKKVTTCWRNRSIHLIRDR